MFYSIIQIKGPMILTEDSFGELQVFAREFFDYDVQENDIVCLKDGMFHYAEEETKKRKQQNFDRMQELFNR
ncbi:MAG: DUF3006 domain-containing protein [Ruminococcaceae bacterium]|nr:DUF3006 domain-containing protein [Oscillospiraceae bacterium]